MKHIFLGMYISAILGVAQAGAHEISSSSPIYFFLCDGQPLTVTGAENSGSCSSFAATSAGTDYSGNENGYVNDFSLGSAILDDQNNGYGAIDYVNCCAGDVDFNGTVAGGNFGSVAPVPKYQTYAMLLAGLGLLGLSARSRRSDPFD